jgi:hypothetical protein
MQYAMELKIMTKITIEEKKQRSKEAKKQRSEEAKKRRSKEIKEANKKPKSSRSPFDALGSGEFTVGQPSTSSPGIFFSFLSMESLINGFEFKYRITRCHSEEQTCHR